MEAILKREIITNKTVCRTLAVSAFVTLTILGAFVRIPLPFTPVPLTLQTLFVLLAGAFLGSRLGAITQICYFALGVSGIAYFLGPHRWIFIRFCFSSFSHRAINQTKKEFFLGIFSILPCRRAIIGKRNSLAQGVI